MGGYLYLNAARCRRNAVARLTQGAVIAIPPPARFAAYKSERRRQRTRRILLKKDGFKLSFSYITPFFALFFQLFLRLLRKNRVLKSARRLNDARKKSRIIVNIHRFVNMHKI